MECLARFVLDMPTKDERRGFLERWTARHGAASGRKLSEEVMRLWELST